MSTSDDSTVQGVHDVAGRLYDLCTAGEYDKVKKILDTHGQRAIAKGLFGYNPLHAAASSGHYKIIELLLQFGADANCKTADGGYTPLHLAASAGQASSVKALLEDEKTDLRVTDAFGRTPTETAEQNFKTDVARSLRSHGESTAWLSMLVYVQVGFKAMRLILQCQWMGVPLGPVLLFLKNMMGLCR